MAIAVISSGDVLKASARALGVPEPAGNGIDGVLLASLLRRTAGIACPCSRSTLAATAFESLQFLTGDDDALREKVGDAIESLVVVGDLLELNQVTLEDPAAKHTWIFCAPPSFVMRPSGGIFILGIVADEVTPLPTSLHQRVVHQGFTRVLPPLPAENLRSVLGDLGLREISRSVWLKSPNPEAASGLHERMVRRLAEQSPSGAIADLLILHPERDVRHYARRWDRPTNESGQYVARRPQDYGAPIWGFATLKDGAVTKFLDFPLRGTRWRGCDVAWHLQMAIDQIRRTPQRYRRRPSSGGACLDFFSPLPLWALRHFEVLGHPAPRENSLFSYWIPEDELAVEEEFLHASLWLARTQSDKEELK